LSPAVVFTNGSFVTFPISMTLLIVRIVFFERL
jgi:hypothetical protein